MLSKVFPRDVPISLMRSWVPLIVTAIAPWCAQWLGLDDGEVTTLVAAAIGGVWYLVFRLLERLEPRFGWLLGWPVSPVYAKDGRHEAGRRGDGGHAHLNALWGFALAVVLVLASVLFGGSAEADPRPSRSKPAQHIGVNRASVCKGVLGVWWQVERLAGSEWVAIPDRGWPGEVVVEVRYIGNGAPAGGHWEALPLAQQSDNYRAVNVVGIPTWDLARVRHRGIASYPETVIQGCSA